MNSSSDWTEVVGAIGIFAVLLALIIVLLTQAGAWMRARMKLAREAEYRDLLERTHQSQESLSRQLTDINLRIQNIETILKQVE